MITSSLVRPGRATVGRLQRASACLLASGALGLLAPAQAAEADGPRNAVNLSATATQEVTQDLLVVTLQAVKEGPATAAAEVQAGLKRLLEAALAEARKDAQSQTMEVRTGEFSVQPRYNSAGRINGWQGSAHLILEGTDAARISQTSGRLSQCNVVNVGYGLSRALRERHESQLTSEAITRFKTRASQIATDFGLKGYTLGEVSVSSSEPGFEPRPLMAMAVRAKSIEGADAALPVEPGKGVLSVTVSGRVLLTP
jgi:predicted secreted protein